MTELFDIYQFCFIFPELLYLCSEQGEKHPLKNDKMTLYDAMCQMFTGNYGTMTQLSQTTGVGYKSLSTMKHRWKNGQLKLETQIRLLNDAGYSVEIIVEPLKK